MSPAEYLTLLKRSWILILSLAVLGAAASYSYASTLPKLYGAQASVIVIPTRGDSTAELVQGSNYVQNLVQTYTVLATAPVVLNKVIQELGLEEQPHQLARRIHVEAPLNTVIIDISATDDTPAGAQEVADATARQLSATVAQLSPAGAGGEPAVRIEVISPARISQIPVEPNTRRYALLGLAAGLGIGVSAALLRRALRTRLTSTADVAEITDLPILGEVASITHAKQQKNPKEPRRNGRSQRSLPAVVIANPAGQEAESLRSIAASLRFVGIGASRKVLLVTSSVEQEGKTSVSIGLSIMLAQSGYRTLLIEADLRRPRIAEITALEGSVGLSTVLMGEHGLEEAVQSWGHPNLSVLTSGELPPNPGQLLSGDQLSEVVEAGRAAYDLVIIDSAPILPVSDSMWLSSHVDGSLIIARLNRTRRTELQRTLVAMEASHAPLLGIILNDVPTDGRSSYYHHPNSAISDDFSGQLTTSSDALAPRRLSQSTVKPRRDADTDPHTRPSR